MSNFTGLIREDQNDRIPEKITKTDYQKRLNLIQSDQRATGTRESED